MLRYRFDEETIKKLEATEWWNLKLGELKKIAPKLQEIVGLRGRNDCSATFCLL